MVIFKKDIHYEAVVMDVIHVLCWNDLIPILSYIFLKGRCRYCGRKLSKEYIVAEIVTGILCELVLWDIDVIEWE